jgi:1-acyl-sn-glycerol-3-phosphate acyltransferase
MTDAPVEPAADSPPVKAQLRRNLLWRLLHPPFWIFCHTWLRLSITGKEHIDDARGGLLLVNHQSFLDPMLVAVELSRPVSYLARDSLFKVPIVSWILRRTHVIPMSREAFRGGSIRAAMDRLEEGFLVGIFPEGTRSSGNAVGKFRGGFLSFARRTSQPVYPVGIAGADQAMPRGAWLIRPARIGVAIGQPFTADEVALLHEAGHSAEAADFARSRVAECQQLAASLIAPQDS